MALKLWLRDCEAGLEEYSIIIQCSDTYLIEKYLLFDEVNLAMMIYNPSW